MMGETSSLDKRSIDSQQHDQDLKTNTSQNLNVVASDLPAYFPMVKYLARKIHKTLPSHVELDELVSAGMLGLVDAARRFVPAKQVKFRSYAQFRVRGAIIDSLRSLDWGPRELRRKGRLLERVLQTLIKRHGRTPSDQEMASEMQLTVQHYQKLTRELRGLELGTLNVERTSDSGDEEITYLTSSDIDDPLYQCIREQVRNQLQQAIEELPERERMMLSLYYTEELTMKQIGKLLGVVELRVSQIHSSAVRRLRRRLSGTAKANGSTLDQEGVLSSASAKKALSA